MHVSAETIYRSLFVQARGDLRHELTRHLRTRRAMRRPAGARLPDGRELRPTTLNISERPAEAADRAVPGHWEGDLVFGRGMSPVATLVERSTRYLMLVGLPDGHRAELVADALAAAITTPPRQLTRSLTWDQGHEMAAHAKFTVDTPAGTGTRQTPTARQGDGRLEVDAPAQPPHPARPPPPRARPTQQIRVRSGRATPGRVGRARTRRTQVSRAVPDTDSEDQRPSMRASRPETS
jgi:hypothetical protein